MAIGLLHFQTNNTYIYSINRHEQHIMQYTEVTSFTGLYQT